MPTDFPEGSSKSVQATPDSPSDEDLVKWLRAKFYTSQVELLQYQAEFNEVMQITNSEDNPVEFGYARLLNNLAEMDQPKLIRLLSVFMWKDARP